MSIIRDIQDTGAAERSLDSLERRALKTTEEVGELAEAVLCLTSASKGKGKGYMDMVEEACDVVIMGLDMALTKPPGMEESMNDDMWRCIVEKIISLKLDKWRKQVESKSTLVKRGEIKFDERELDGLLEPEDVIEQELDDAFALRKNFIDPETAAFRKRIRENLIRTRVPVEEMPVDPTIEPMNDKEQFLWDQCKVPYMEEEFKAIFDEMDPGWRDEQDAALKEFRQRKIAAWRTLVPEIERFVEDPETGLIARESTVRKVQES